LKQTIISRNKGVITFWLSVTLAIISIAMLSSCSTRKVVIDEVKKDSLSQIFTKIVTKEDIKTETKNDIITDEFTITPLDTCKDIVIDGKTYRNVVLRYKKTKDNTIQVQDIKVAKDELKTQDTKVTQNRKVKNIERKLNPMMNLLWLLIPLSVYVIYKFKLV
jgi:hypothetical protein